MKTLEQFQAELLAERPQASEQQISEWASARFERQVILTRKTWPTKAEFWNEFSPAEQLAIMGSTEPAIRILDRQLLVWPGEVWSDDPRVTGGLDALVAAEILTLERKAEILAKP